MLWMNGCHVNVKKQTSVMMVIANFSSKQLLLFVFVGSMHDFSCK